MMARARISHLLAVIVSAVCWQCSYAYERGSGGTFRLQRRRKQQDVFDELYGDFDVEEWENMLSEESEAEGEADPSTARKKTSRSCKGKGKSCSPTMFPSEAPSNLPTISPAPSSSPSSLPSLSPSLSPSDQPSPSPSISPRPSSIPSVAPSARPTEPVVFTERSASGGLVTSCVEQPPEDEGVLIDQRLLFRYNLYTTPEADFDQLVAIMEIALHDAVSKEFITCSFEDAEDTDNAANTRKHSKSKSSGDGGGDDDDDDDASFFVVAVSNDPEDSLSKAQCNTENDPALSESQESKCAVVNAELTMRAYFPPSSSRLLQGRSTDASPEVLTATGGYLDAAMRDGDLDSSSDQVLQLSFQGFVNAQGAAGDGRETGGSGGIAAAIGGDTPRTSNIISDNKLALGACILGVAALFLILVLVATGRRRRQRQEAYLEHLEAISDTELSYNGGVKKNQEALGEGKVLRVLDHSAINSSAETSSLSLILRDLDSSRESGYGAGPEVDRWESNPRPVFMSTEDHHGLYHDNWETNPRSMRSVSTSRSGYSASEWHRSVDEIRESYRSPDTVNL